MKRALCWASLALAACQPHAQSAQRSAAKIESCEYELELQREGTVKVDARCSADGPFVFRVGERAWAGSVRGPRLDANGRVRGVAPAVSYVVDLAEVSQHGRGFDSAARIGDSFMAPMSRVLLVPEPLTSDIPVKVRVRAEPSLRVAVGLSRDGDPDSYRLMAHEIPVATYFAFGKLELRRVRVGSSELELTKLDAPLDQSFEQVGAWVERSARAVGTFYGEFPVPRASVMVVPVARRNSVLFGKVLPESEPAVALVLGQHAKQRELYSDWILVHELFHLGVPSFFEEGKWLDEGLATYFEPIIRVRAGLYGERELWDELERSLPQGLDAFTGAGLEAADDFRGIYWGGAIACLAADVAARKRRLDRGLETGLRAVHAAGGRASEVWSLADTIAVIDRALGGPTLAPIAAAHAAQGSPFDLAGLLRDLGVSRGRDDALQLSDSAPLAAIRRAIVSGG